MGRVENVQGSVRTNLLAIISLFFASIPIVATLLVVVLGFIFPYYFSAPPGHYSPLLGPSARVVYVVAVCASPLSIILGVVSLLQISASKGEQKGMGLAWTALGLGFAPMICGVLTALLPFILLPFATDLTPSAPSTFVTGQTPSAASTSALSTMKLSRLSGEWTGVETLTRAGKCTLAGGSDSVSNPVRMTWTVNDEGDVEITLPEWPGVYPYTFTGKAQPDLSVSLELSTSAMCGGNPHPYAAHYANTIQTKGDTLTLEMEATEVWCPAVCIFRRHYSIQKSVTPP